MHKLLEKAVDSRVALGFIQTQMSSKLEAVGKTNKIPHIPVPDSSQGRCTKDQRAHIKSGYKRRHKSAHIFYSAILLCLQHDDFPCYYRQRHGCQFTVLSNLCLKYRNSLTSQHFRLPSYQTLKICKFKGLLLLCRVKTLMLQWLYLNFTRQQVFLLHFNLKTEADT